MSENIAEKYTRYNKLLQKINNTQITSFQLDYAIDILEDFIIMLEKCTCEPDEYCFCYEKEDCSCRSGECVCYTR